MKTKSVIPHDFSGYQNSFALIDEGIIGFARQIGRASESALKAVSQSMAELNKTASELMRKMRI